MAPTNSAMIFATLLLIWGNCAAADPGLQKVEDYLNHINTLQLEFVQYDTKHQRKGTLYLSKPHRIRWQYETPKETLLIGNKRQYIYYDPKLQEVTHVPASKVSASFLTYSRIKFGANVKVLNHTIKEDQISIELSTANDPNRTTLLYFNSNPLRLRGLEVHDKEEQLRLSFSFSNVIINQPIDDKMFVFANPHIFRDK